MAVYTKNQIVEWLAEAVCYRISEEVIEELKKLDPLMADDHENVWNEIRVQVQGVESTIWGHYEDLALTYITPRAKALPAYKLSAVWQHTWQGEEWSDLPKDQQCEYEPSVEDVAEHILRRFLLSDAQD